MSNELYRLSASTAVEPLVNRWSAWSHVIAPVAASLHLANYQIDILRSYLANPRAHVQACQNPKLRSGRFVEIREERAWEVGEFLGATEVEQRENLRFAKALIEFHNYLVQEATGLSLDPFYQRLPSELSGYVELIYDYYCRPSIRCLEALLYESQYYNKKLQSLRLFRQERDNSRSFFMSTPRLADKNAIDWTVSFECPEVDDLFRLDSRPQPLGYIRELLGLNPDQHELLQTLVTSEPVPVRESWDGSTARIRYFGHACVLIEWKGISILTDPCIGVVPQAGGIDRFTYQDLPERIDYAIVTHNHHDHFCLETLLRLRHSIEALVVPRSFGMFYGDLSLKFLGKRTGFKNIIELDTLESIPIPDGAITAVPFMGEHADLPHGKTAYVVRVGDEQILFGADSDCLDRRMYDHIRKILGPVETVFLGMECVGAPLSWSCGSFLPFRPEASIERSRRYKGCDSTRAMNILESLGTKRIYLYAMGIEPWLEHLLGLAYSEDATQLKEARRLLAQAREKGFEDAELLVGKRELHWSDAARKARISVQPARGASAGTNFAQDDEFVFD